jgi:dTDP-4-dehydrorhamnose reductase
MPIRALVIGGSGYVGQALVRLLSRKIETWWTYFRCLPAHAETARFLDLRDPSSVAALIEEVAPDIIYHLAYDPTDFDAVIVDGTRNLLESLASIRPLCQFLYLSTDAVFDGEESPYCESDQPRPSHAYGRAKWNAEKMVLDYGGIVVRTSLVYGFNPPDPRTLKLLRALKSGRFQHPYFIDEIRCPIFVDDLCEALIELGDGKAGEHRIVHVAGPEALSRYAFACMLAESSGYGNVSIPGALFSESGLERPQVLVLDTRLAASLLSSELRSAQAVFKAFRVRMAGIMNTLEMETV